MKRTICMLLLTIVCSFSQKQKILSQDYSFLGVDNEVKKLSQSNDTLYEMHCYINRPCQPSPEKHYKIISTNKTKEFTILKLERLDTIPLTSNPYPATRYFVLALKNINDKQLGYLPLIFGLTKSQIDTTDIDAQSLKGKFFFTYFSEAYLKECTSLKKIVTKDDAKEIFETAKNDDFKALVQSYTKTNTKDMYSSGLSAELLNKACIAKGFNPIGAGQRINALLK